MTAAGKKDIIEKALAAGIINDPRWLDSADEPMPAWAVMELALKLLEQIDPPYGSYD
jgi:hypothetical protein